MHLYFIKWRVCMRVCLRALRVLRTWHACMLSVIAYFMRSSALHACVIGVFYMLVCLTFLSDLCTWRAYLLEVFHKMVCLTYLACLKLMKCFVDMFDD